MKHKNDASGWNLSDRATQPLRCSAEYLHAIAEAEQQIRTERKRVSDFELASGFSWWWLPRVFAVMAGLGLIGWIGFEVFVAALKHGL